MEISGGSLYAASKTIVTALKPEQPGKVRSDRCMYSRTSVQRNSLSSVSRTMARLDFRVQRSKILHSQQKIDL